MARRQKNQRTDKRFQVSLQIGVIGGKRQRVYFYGKTKDEAEQKKLAYMRTHPAKSNPDDRNITLGTWADRWLKLYKSALADNTQEMYKSGVIYIKKFIYEDEKGSSIPIKDMKIVDVRPYHLQALAASMSGFSKSYIRQIRQTMGQIFETACDNHIISESPALRLSFPSGSYEGHRALEEFEKELVYKHWREHRAGLWAMIMMYAGLRRGEVIALTWNNVDLKKRLLYVDTSHDVKHKKNKDPKSEAGDRVIPLLPQLYNALAEMEKKSGAVCLSVKGKQLTEIAFRRGWEGYMLVLERALNGIEPYNRTGGWRKDIARANPDHKQVDFDPHDLRYTYATMLYDAGVDVKTAQVLLGHKDLATTMKIYTQLSEKTKKSSIDKLMNYFKDNDF